MVIVPPCRVCREFVFVFEFAGAGVPLPTSPSSIGATMYVRHASLSVIVCRRSHCVMVTWCTGPYCISLRCREPLMYVVPWFEFPAIVFLVVIFKSACAASAQAQMLRMIAERRKGFCTSALLFGSALVMRGRFRQQDTTNRPRRPENARAKRSRTPHPLSGTRSR